jgi:DNA-binding beta-propeller fold protein YncE
MYPSHSPTDLLVIVALSLATCGCSSLGGTARQGTSFRVDPFWPKPLPHDWIVGQVAGVAVDARDHVWIVHRPLSLTAREAGAAQDPPLAECCIPAPSVIEFDREGNVVSAWGGPDSVETDRQGSPTRSWHHGERWPQSEHGIFVDHLDDVWIGSNGANDHVVLKFDRAGRRLLTIGEWGVTAGSADTAHLGGPADVTVDPTTNEVYIADGYVNRRIIVFDAATGAYRRHWGAYGEPPDDRPLPPYDPNGAPARSFRSPIHAVRISEDGLVYAADRVNNRIQVFRKDGAFVREAFLAPRTLAMGSVWDLELSPDSAQMYVYVPDGTNMKVWILDRQRLEPVGTFGRGGRNAGSFEWVHNLAADSRGNLYTTEVNTGKRIQRFIRVDRGMGVGSGE